jgi:CHAD domain-containing protein
LIVDSLFELRQDRVVYAITTQEGARLVVSADRARLVGSQEDDPLQRIEVELVEGPVESLIRFARDLRRALKLKPAGESKFEYGLREAGLVIPAPAAGPAPRIRPRDTVRKAAARSRSLYFRQMLRHEPGTRLGINPECLHDMRVSVRRMRAVLRMFRGALPPATTAKAAEELRWLGQSLGAARDLDVHIEECPAMLKRHPTVVQTSSLCRRGMERQRDRAYDSVCADLRSPRFKTVKTVCRDLIRLARRPTATGGGEISAHGTVWLRRDLRAVLKAGRAVTVDSPDAAMHRLRIRCKRLRYACETLREIYGKPAVRMARNLAELQEVLGAYQDAATAQALIMRTATERAAAPDGAAAHSFSSCAAAWRDEQTALRAAFPTAWKKFDRKRTRRAFLKALGRLESGETS